MNRLPAVTTAIALALSIAMGGEPAATPTTVTPHPIAVAAPADPAPVVVAPAPPEPIPAPAAPPPARSATAPQPARRATLVRRGSPWFATPQAAMRYLARAYNRSDITALKQVTTPTAREELLRMRREATSLRLIRCTRNPAGDYTCLFRHWYPAAMHRRGYGQATFIAAPADRHGWYMTVLESCG